MEKNDLKSRLLHPRRIYSTKETAILLGVSIQTMINWRRDKVGPPWRNLTPGRKKACIRYYGRDLLNYLESVKVAV